MRNIRYYYLCLQILEFIFIAQCQTIEEDFQNPCTSARTCGDCIHISPLCAWCGAEIYSRELPRCDKLDNLQRNCENSQITNPLSNFQKIRDDDFTSGGKSKPPIQLKPQQVKFVLRPNEPKQFKLKFEQQANYPVDLYFLLDLSYGMHRQAEAQERLIALGNDIPVSMANITNNFRLGFGTFVDKVVMPYTAWTDKMLQDRCPSKVECSYPHDFINRLSIGSEQSSFANSMKSALEIMSQSLDDYEGGLDGLIQVLGCDVIGWRNISRRIIVYSSNSLFHLAGAGKLGGATKQNDLKCNLTADGHYANQNIYDYPSVSQIAQMMRDNKANVIFAVMSDVSDHYKALGNFLDGAVVGELEDDSTNIVGLIKDKYYELRSRIEIQPSKSNNVDVQFMSKCKGSVHKETSVCQNLEIMDSVEFDVTITVNKSICQGQSASTLQKEVILNAVGLNEAVIVNLDIQCSCECETSTLADVNSLKCTSGNGTFECGICDCNPGRFGRLCECDTSDISQIKSLEACRADRNDSLTCSGKGECICGVCECLPIPGVPSHTYSGIYCECNNYNCRRGKNNLLCGGSSRGNCNCGTCACLAGWTGKSCECTMEQESCVATNDILCNGVGTCQCGRCICNSSSGMFGPTCEDCLTCPSQCNEFVDCVQCKIGLRSSGHSSGEIDCDLNCNNYTSSKQDSLPSGDGIKICDGTDPDGCTFYFAYKYNSDNEVILTIQETRACPIKVNEAAIIGGTIAAVVLIPLILICLFIFLRTLKDKEEYAKFLKDKQKAHWDTGANPLYKGAVTTYENVNYKGETKDTGVKNVQETEM